MTGEWRTLFFSWDRSDPSLCAARCWTILTCLCWGSSRHGSWIYQFICKAGSVIVPNLETARSWRSMNEVLSIMDTHAHITLFWLGQRSSVSTRLIQLHCHSSPLSGRRTHHCTAITIRCHKFISLIICMLYTLFTVKHPVAYLVH